MCKFELEIYLTIFIHQRLRKAFKVSMPGLGEGGWAETHFEDCTLEEMWEKMCRWGAFKKGLYVNIP